MKNFLKIDLEKGAFIIADFGVNYYDIAKKQEIALLDAAKLMIDKAVENGIDAVKFQTYKAEKIASKYSPSYWDLSEEPSTSQYELFKKFDKFEESDYIELANYCETKKTIFLSTPFDFEAVDFLDKLMPFFKISSSDLTNLPFIEYIANKKKPILLSTGAADLGEICDAVEVIESTGNEEICIMHCILSYPTKYEDVNLNMIKHLKNVFPNYLIGFSDHSKPDISMLTTTLAYVYGARIIEKHFTLDKLIKGNDHYHAMDPTDLNKLRSNLNFIELISGQYQKKSLECEKQSRKFARRSIVSKTNIKKGEIITIKKITFKRPGTGIKPEMILNVIGATALEDINEDEILTFEKIRLISKNE